MRIELAGGIGVGKSTLCKAFQLLGCTPVFEDLKSNPFLTPCYDNPSKFKFPSQMWFALTKFHEIGLQEHPDKVYVHDQAILNNNAYTNMLFRNAEDQEGWDIISHCFWYTENFLGRPDLIVNLQCDEDEQVKRIQRRGRDFEKTVDIEFIRKFNKEIKQLLEKASYKGYTIEDVNITNYSIKDYVILAEEIMLKYIDVPSEKEFETINIVA